MLTDLTSATRDYWRKLDAVEAAYQRGELSIQAVDAEVKQLMAELGAARRQALRDFWVTLQVFVGQQREAIAGTAAIMVLAYFWIATVA
ncbi:MAG: hypothetical protein AAF773_19090 [Cyanobacteria bacterium P01_D01_bin.115]